MTLRTYWRISSKGGHWAYRRAHGDHAPLLVSQASDAPKTAAALIDLAALLHIEPVDHLILQQALTLGRRDFEDAVQAVTAAQCQADYLVTRQPARLQAKAWFPS